MDDEWIKAYESELPKDLFEMDFTEKQGKALSSKLDLAQLFNLYNLHNQIPVSQPSNIWGYAISPSKRVTSVTRMISHIYVDGNKKGIMSWEAFYDGVLHCEDGPAVVYTDGTGDWYVNGNRIK